MWTRHWHAPHHPHHHHHHPVTAANNPHRRRSEAEEKQAETEEKQEEEAKDEAEDPHEKTALLVGSTTCSGSGSDSSSEQKRLLLKRGYSDDDLPELWTFSRRMAHQLSKFSWYLPPRKNEGQNTSTSTTTTTNTSTNSNKMLHDAWGFFEHVTLPRHFINTNTNPNQKQNLEKAQPGEVKFPTKLYSVWKTHEDDLSDFGIGVGLYFFTLRALAVIFLIAGLINLPAMLYYASPQYNDDIRGHLDFILRGSAICTDQRWAPCPSCRWHDWDYFPRQYDRYAQTVLLQKQQNKKTAVVVVTEQSLQFIKVNSCSFGYTLGFYALISVGFMAMALYVLCFVILRKREIVFDEQAQTAQDYSLRVENPPQDAHDPEEWKAFFSQFGMVTACTIALENEVLVQALVERRRLLIQLEAMLKPGIEFDKHDLDHAVANSSIPKQQTPSWWKKTFLRSCSASDIRDKIKLLDEDIQDLSQQIYKVADVFVTFETEHAQRKALKSMSLSYLAPIQHAMGKTVVPEQYLFRSKHLLNVEEAPEPTAVRWAELHTTVSVRSWRNAL